MELQGNHRPFWRYLDSTPQFHTGSQDNVYWFRVVRANTMNLGHLNPKSRLTRSLVLSRNMRCPPTWRKSTALCTWTTAPRSLSRTLHATNCWNPQPTSVPYILPTNQNGGTTVATHMETTVRCHNCAASVPFPSHNARFDKPMQNQPARKKRRAVRGRTDHTIMNRPHMQ